MFAYLKAIMDNYQFFTILGTLAAGFGWLIHQISDLKIRVTVIETILAMMGAPVKPGKGKLEE